MGYVVVAQVTPPLSDVRFVTWSGWPGWSVPGLAWLATRGLVSKPVGLAPLLLPSMTANPLQVCTKKPKSDLGNSKINATLK